MFTLMFLCWWWGGFAFAIWAWTEHFDEIDPATVVVALFLTSILGPILGLLWWPQEKHPLWRRKK